MSVRAWLAAPICAELGFDLAYLSHSYRKANGNKIGSSFTGIGDELALSYLVLSELNLVCPVLSLIGTTEVIAATVCRCAQIPAFLCRQVLDIITQQQAAPGKL